jgi:hypothetical protein
MVFGSMMKSEIEARLERIRGRSVMICTPVARNPVWQYTASLASTLMLLQEYGVKCTFQFVVGSSVICKARNELCAHFLMSGYSDLLFIDDDMQWNAGDVLRLLASDKPLIGGVGRMRVEKPNTDPAVWCWRPLVSESKTPIQDDMGAVEVLGFGAALMLVNRVVFLKMAEAHPEWKREGAKDWPQGLRDHYFEFFRQNEDGAAGEVSEDYVFCNRFRALGGRIFVDPTIRLGHVGTFNFWGSISELMQEA